MRELPEDIFERFDRNLSRILNLRVKAWSSKTYYIQKVLPKLLEFGYPLLPFLRLASYLGTNWLGAYRPQSFEKKTEFMNDFLCISDS